MWYLRVVVIFRIIDFHQIKRLWAAVAARSKKRNTRSKSRETELSTPKKKIKEIDRSGNALMKKLRQLRPGKSKL